MWDWLRPQNIRFSIAAQVHRSFHRRVGRSGDITAFVALLLDARRSITHSQQTVMTVYR